MNIPQGFPLSVRMTISPTAPGTQERPFSSTMSTSYWGLGLPMAPIRGSAPKRLPTVRVVSVWPKPSIKVRPVAAFHWRYSSGLRASPAVLE